MNAQDRKELERIEGRIDSLQATSFEVKQQMTGLTTELSALVTSVNKNLEFQEKMFEMRMTALEDDINDMKDDMKWWKRVATVGTLVGGIVGAIFVEVLLPLVLKMI